MRKFLVKRYKNVTLLYFKDDVVFFRKENIAGYTIEVIEEFGEYSEYIHSILDKLSEDTEYDINIIKKREI